MTRPARPPRLFFSFRSPYSWLTIRRLRRHVADCFDSLNWFPYWEPDQESAAALAARGAQLHYAQMSRAKHLYLLMDTKRIAHAEGVAMAWPIDVDPHWEVPHLGWLAARRHGRAEAFYDEVVAARWLRGENICQPDVIAGCADRAGIDPAAITGAVDNAEIRAEGVDCLERAYLDDVFGVPYLRWGQHRFWGLDRLAAFLAVWPPTAVGASAQLPAVMGSSLGDVPLAHYDNDSPGGCG